MGRPNATKPDAHAAADAAASYSLLRPSLDTGDLVLYGGKSSLCRRIQRLTGSSWSHVAMLIKVESHDLVLIWEATSAADMADVETGRVGPGVRLTLFSEWVARYPEVIAVRRLAAKRTPEMMAAFGAFRREMAGRPYEKKRMQLLRSGLHGPLSRNKKEDLSSVFCSELVAATYQRMGLLPTKPPSNAYTPKDFSSERRPGLRLLRGAKLGEEVFVSR
jgi:hypothetical protein